MNWRFGENLSGTMYSPLPFPPNILYFTNSQFHDTCLAGNTNQNFIAEHESYLEQKQNDERFISNFVKSKSSKIVLEDKESPIKIFEAKKYLMEIISLKGQLESECEALDVSSEEFDVNWESIVLKQNTINTLLTRFNNESLKSLNKSLKKRNKKRKWEKKRKEAQKAEKLKREEKIKVKHALIDKLLSKKTEETESIKRKEGLKRQADMILHEVRKKKYESKKMLNLLGAILKLRELRSQQEIAQGGYCSEQVSETFKNVISHFQELWKKRSEIYNLEEKGLKVMLDEGEIPHVKISDFQKILNQWEQAMFGSPTIDTNFRFLTEAADDPNSLILIRREWDQYITKSDTVLSSCIPIGWVLPPETDNDEWKSFVRVKKR